MTKFNEELIVKLAQALAKYGIVRQDVRDGTAYLKRYGYLEDNHTQEDFVKAVRNFQEYFHLKQDGIFGPKTLRAMSDIRCGVPDRMEARSSLSKWGLKELTYYISGWVKGLSQDEQRNIYKQAFNSWSNVCNLSFVETTNSSKANIIVLSSSSRRDGLGTSGNVLAYAYLPPSSNYKGQLKVVFDLAETWITNPRMRGILLLNVAAHEFGHLCGLDHSKIEQALMAPYYNALVEKPVENDDITRIQALYGKPEVQPEPEPDPIPTPTPDPSPNPSPTEEKLIRVKGMNLNIEILDNYRLIPTVR